MGQDLKPYLYYISVFRQLLSCKNISEDLSHKLVSSLYQIDQQNIFSKPMRWIGNYIALASLVFIILMVADLFHGFRKKKLWFPCIYFTLNAASLTLIAIAMKLPVDLNNSMPRETDQGAKLGSMAFLCVMMANLLPSLATMNNKELLTNIIALGVLVITLVVNVCIQIGTGVISFPYSMIAFIYVGMVLLLLIIHTCSALMILKSKEILESKYQARHETTMKELESHQPRRLTIEELKQYVRNHLIMAESGSPQFVTAYSATACASGVICVLSTIIHFFTMIYASIPRYNTPVTMGNKRFGDISNYQSDYSWSILVILMTQFMGSLVGTISPLFRCFASLNFKLSKNWIRNHIKVFKVESYWTQKLSNWKQSRILFLISNRKSKFVIHSFKILVLNICIGLQKTVVVLCKMTVLIPVFFGICILCCKQCWKWLKAKFGVCGIVLVENPEQLEDTRDWTRYVLQLEDDMELAEETLKRITKSMNHLIEKAKKIQSNNLMKLLDKSRNFEGVGKYDSLCVPPLDEEEYLSCWSVTLVTLTTIAISLTNIQQHVVDTLLSGVSKGLVYVTHVEETLNAIGGYVKVQKAAKDLWLDVELYQIWLGNNLQRLPHDVKTSKQILEWFTDTAKKMVFVDGENGCSNDNSIFKSICANSMYRISESLLLSYQDNIDEVSLDELYEDLTSMIADILAACLTNLPQVIVMKCHSSVIENRETSFQAAAQLLGETMQIINNLNDREIPTLNPDELPFIDKWHACLKRPVP